MPTPDTSVDHPTAVRRWLRFIYDAGENNGVADRDGDMGNPDLVFEDALRDAPNPFTDQDVAHLRERARACNFAGPCSLDDDDLSNIADTIAATLFRKDK